MLLFVGLKSVQVKLDEIKNVVNEYLKGKDIELVDIVAGDDNVIEIEVDSLKGVTIDECVEISCYVESQFDRDKEDYELTVASYSISSPFRTSLQYRKNIGRDVKVKLTDGVIIAAKLTAASENDFTLEYDEKVAVEGKKRKEMQHFVRTINYDSVACAELMF